jgi:hypothetical protein
MLAWVESRKSALRNARLQRITELVSAFSALQWTLAQRLLPVRPVTHLQVVASQGTRTPRRALLLLVPVLFVVGAISSQTKLMAQELSPAELLQVQQWYVRTVERTGTGSGG